MKKMMLTLLVVLFFVFVPAHAKAASTDAFTIYLPAIFNNRPVGVVRSATTPGFRVESIRLWHVTENGGVQTPSLQCGDKHKLQVHVFDINGDHGEQSRLNGVSVHVEQSDAQGSQDDRVRATGTTELGPGAIEFELTGTASVFISYEVDGHPVTSEIATVTDTPAEIPFDRLIASGYCSDAATCAAFVQANTCIGTFSWNVVFIRNAKAGQ